MTTKWCLLKVSDGDRGANGKKKVYEVVITGTTVTMSWGMAEKPSRQTKTMTFASEGQARQEALNKVWEKRSTGYALAYSV
jgi:predicted DNA-binding WGR domain protein